MTQSLVLSIDVCHGLGISPLRFKHLAELFSGRSWPNTCRGMMFLRFFFKVWNFSCEDLCPGRQLSSQKTKQDFSTLGTLKNVPCSLNELLVNFREESSGIGRFCRLEFRRMANWSSQKIETGRIIPGTKQAACFVQFTLFR